VIYPGKLTAANCFRIGSIGQLSPGHMVSLVQEVEAVLTDMGVRVPVTQIPMPSDSK